MKLYVYNIAPLWWPILTEEEKKDIHLVEIEYNTNTSAQPLNKGDDIVRPILKDIELENKEFLG